MDDVIGTLSAHSVPVADELRGELLGRVRARWKARARHLRGRQVRLLASDVGTLFHAYDAVFFEGRLAAGCTGGLDFALSRRMTRSAGMTRWWGRERRGRITLSATLLATTFPADPQERRVVTVCGLPTHDLMEGAMRVMEHEIVHLIEFVGSGRSSCGRAPFRALVRDLFGHRTSTHRLVAPAEVAAERYQLVPGSAVRFQWKGAWRSGILTRVTTRATVMSPDPAGDFRDRAGRRYARFYLPVSMLVSDSSGSAGSSGSSG